MSQGISSIVDVLERLVDPLKDIPLESWVFLIACEIVILLFAALKGYFFVWVFRHARHRETRRIKSLT